MNIPIYRLPYSKDDIDFVTDHISKILETGYLTDGGPYVKEFETAWSKFTECQYSIAVNSCTTALETILRCVGVSNRSVLVPTYTFYATPMSVINAGGSVIFGDISPKTLSLSLETVEKNVRDDTVAIIMVHVAGIISDEIIKIRKFCDKKNIILIEDAACAHGAELNQVKAGTLGHVSAFSFHHSKVLTTGEGGMISTDDYDLNVETRIIRAIGLNRSINNWEVFGQGNNYKMSEITAALGLLHVKNAEKILQDRRDLAKFYDKNIEFNSNVSRFIMPPGSISSYYKYVIQVSHPELKDVIRARLENEFEIFLPPNIYDHACHLQGFSSHPSVLNRDDDFSNSMYMIDHHVCLNMYNGITDEERVYIVDSLNHVISTL